MQLKFSKNAITGNLAGKPIHCVARITEGTGSPPAGVYTIPPPMRDPVYGLTALLLPLEQGGAPGTAAGINYIKGYAQAKASALAEKWAAPPSALVAAAGGSTAEAKAMATGVLVLSDKPIAGRNCLVVSLGFADLMLGLETSGGATLTVL